MSLDLEWVPRDQNEEADALSNGDFHDFRVENRVEIDLAETKWIVLTELMQVATCIYEEVKQRRTARPAAPAAVQKTPKRAKLREREPWG